MVKELLEIVLLKLICHTLKPEEILLICLFIVAWLKHWVSPFEDEQYRGLTAVLDMIETCLSLLNLFNVPQHTC